MSNSQLIVLINQPGFPFFHVNPSPQNCTVKWSSQAAHLVNFLGTDTVAALLCTKKYYHAKMLGILRIGRQKEVPVRANCASFHRKSHAGWVGSGVFVLMIDMILFVVEFQENQNMTARYC